MTSWKRLFGKKTKKAHQKIEQKFDQWMKHIHSDGTHPEIQKTLKEMEKEKKSVHGD